MSGSHEEVEPPRLRFEHGPDGREWIRIPAPRPHGQVLALSLGILLVGQGGVRAFVDFAHTYEPAKAFFGLFCMALLLWPVLALLWILFGAELVGVTGGDLHIVHRLPGLARGRVYRGGEISGLAPSQVNGPLMGQKGSFPFVTVRWGAVEFHYRRRRIWFAQSLGEAEGRLIVERLKLRLPARASGDVERA
jgi:hypothetical protein